MTLVTLCCGPSPSSGREAEFSRRPSMATTRHNVVNPGNLELAVFLLALLWYCSFAVLLNALLNATTWCAPSIAANVCSVAVRQSTSWVGDRAWFALAT
jgi:hypothetical protein